MDKEICENAYIAFKSISFREYRQHFDTFQWMLSIVLLLVTHLILVMICATHISPPVLKRKSH